MSLTRDESPLSPVLSPVPPAEPSGRPAPSAPPGQARRPEPLWRELVGEQLRTIRQERGDTLRGVASRARVSPQYLSEVERGFKEPSSEILAAIGAAIDTSLLDLASGVARRLHTAEAPAGAATRVAAAPVATVRVATVQAAAARVAVARAYSLAA